MRRGGFNFFGDDRIIGGGNSFVGGMIAESHEDCGEDETFGDMIKQVQDHKGGAERAKTLAFGKLVAFFETAVTVMFHGDIISRGRQIRGYLASRRKQTRGLLKFYCLLLVARFFDFFEQLEGLHGLEFRCGIFGKFYSKTRLILVDLASKFSTSINCF